MRDAHRHFRRFGLVNTVLRSAYNRLRRLLYLNISVIEVHFPRDELQPSVQGYETREIDSAEFHANLCAELGKTNMRWAFDRGDFCVASLYQNKVVGFNFWTQQDTRVAPGIVFVIPPQHIYSFAAQTAPPHRGKGLSPERWKVAAPLKRRYFGDGTPTIHYTEVVNFESRSSGQSYLPPSLRVGYAGFMRLWGRWVVFGSSGCRQYGAGFATEQPS